MDLTIGGRAVNRMPCCGPFALATLTGRTPQEVFDLLKVKYGFSASWKGRTHWLQLTETLVQDFGMTADRLVSFSKITLSRFVRDFAEPGTSYLLRIANHFVVVRDGVVIDQCGSVPIALYRRRRSRITHAAIVSKE